MPKGPANYEKFRTQEYDTICDENNVKQKGKSPTWDGGFVEKAEETVGPPKNFTQQLIKELGAGKVIKKRIVRGEVIGKKVSNLGSNFKKFLAHRLCHQHRGSHSAEKNLIQEKSRVGKSGAKKDLF